MKKLAAAVLLSVAFGEVSAQGSVSMYGIVDEGILYNSNAGGKSSYSMTSGVMQGSRWGLIGEEDLGGGVKSIFRLENGFDPSTGNLGQGGREFGRQAYVGIASGAGTVILGRTFDSVVDFVGPFSVGASTSGNIASHPGDIDNYLGQYRISNAIKYTSPIYGGLTFGGLYSIGGVAGSISRNQVWSIGMTYSGKPFKFAVALLNARNPNLGFAGANANVNVPVVDTTTFFSSPVVSGFSSARTYQVIAAAASYDFDSYATIGATYSNIQFANLGDPTSGPNKYGYAGTAVFNDYEINVKSNVTPALGLALAYNYLASASVASVGGENHGAKYHQLSFAADYFLSKRTDIYAICVYQKAQGTNSLNTSAVAAISAVTPSAGDHQVVARIGIRHRF